MKLTIGTATFDSIMRDRLSKILSKFFDVQKGKSDRVLEVMAGTGRNFSVLNQYFEHVEQLEQSINLTKKMDSRVLKHIVRI